MNDHADKTCPKAFRTIANTIQNKHGNQNSTFEIEDNRPEKVAQGKLQSVISNGARIMPSAQMQVRMDGFTIQQKSPIRKHKVDQGNTKSIPIQRKVLIDEQPYVPEMEEEVSEKVQAAIDDEYLRYYDSEEQAKGHIEGTTPGNIGLIKPRALWYKIPYLNEQFFVFGEYHSAVKGSHIKEASNITKPIVDESRGGWSVDELNTNALESAQDTGLDEDTSKLLRALEMWYFLVRQESDEEEGEAPTLPKIPKGETSTREERGGTKRLIVYGEGGKEEYWKPESTQQAPLNTYDAQTQMLDAIEVLFAKVFAKEIRTMELDELPNGENVERAWLIFKNKSWKGNKAENNIKKHVSAYLYGAAKYKVDLEYSKLESSSHSEDINKGDKSKWSADHYRDEYMFVRVLEAKGEGTFAFANMGNSHLKRLKGRLESKGIPYILAEDFFGQYSKDAVDTKAIAYNKSAEFRGNQRMELWYKGASLRYSELQPQKIDTLNNYDLGEFVIKGKVTKLEEEEAGQEGKHNQPVLMQFLKDIKKAYPNSDQFLEGLSLEEVGEFLTTEKVKRWDEMGN